MTRPSFGSLFSGIGGLDLGLERAGWTVRWQVEIDDFCRRVLAKHWPDVPRFKDVRMLTGAELERVDLIAGGFPCQPVSYAGQRRAQADARWLWPEFARFIRVLRPSLVLVENVPGLYQRGLGIVLADMAASGYDAEWDCLPAFAFGAPHLRWRVLVVAHARGLESRPQPLGEPWRGTPTEPGHDGAAELVADADRDRQLQPIGVFGQEWRRPGDQSWWAVEPDVGRVAHGVPSRVDRLRGLGNAVVPQVVEFIGRRLLEARRSMKRP